MPPSCSRRSWATTQGHRPATPSATPRSIPSAPSLTSAHHHLAQQPPLPLRLHQSLPRLPLRHTVSAHQRRLQVKPRHPGTARITCSHRLRSSRRTSRASCAAWRCCTRESRRSSTWSRWRRQAVAGAWHACLLSKESIIDTISGDGRTASLGLDGRRARGFASTMMWTPEVLQLTVASTPISQGSTVKARATAAMCRY